ncbi:hypothetical protein MKEN_00432300 [Mycena kentingensis (nom. inval.)]|nr:hypothetical protein MKEN_00432300 [Mycena kentingensis (nom. inval.)]
MSDLDFTHCGSFLDQDLLKNIMGDISNTTYTLACTGGLGSVLQTAAPLKPCGAGSFTTFCIGARGQQHGCYAGSCNLLDWTGTIAPSRNNGIIKYIRLQTAGLLTPCCTKDGQCSPPVAPFECDNSRSFQMCIADGQSTLCIDPVTKSMCSANYTLVVDRDTTFKTCAGGGFFDMDLFSDTMGEVMNRTYTFECVGNTFSIQSPPFTQCPTFIRTSYALHWRGGPTTRMPGGKLPHY